MSDLRKLAKEIVRSLVPLNHELALIDEDLAIKAETSRIVARLRSALPELSQLLGELAVARLALEKAEALHLEERRAVNQSDAEFFECQICYQEGGNDLPPIPHDARVPCPFAALSSGSGRLAGELIRQVARCRSVHKKGAQTPGIENALDALLQSFPALRAEVER